MKLLPRRLILIGLIVLGFAAVIATSIGQATAPPEVMADQRRPANTAFVYPAESISAEILPSIHFL